MEGIATTSKTTKNQPQESILVQLAKKLVKKYNNPSSSLGRIGSETSADLTRFAIFSGIINPLEPKITRDHLRHAIKIWWNQENFDVEKQIVKTLTISQFEVDCTEIRQIFTSELGLQFQDLAPGESDFIVRIIKAYSHELLDKTLVPKSESDSESSDSESTVSSIHSEIEIEETEMAQQQKVKIQPRFYAGEKSEPINDWLDHYEVVARTLEWSPEYMFNMVPVYLQGDAQRYFKRILGSPEKPTDFEGLKTKLIDRFRDPYMTQKLRFQLNNIRQKPNQSARNFANQVLDLCYEIDPTMSSEDIVRFIQLGVKEEIASMLAPLDISKLSDLLSAIARVEKTLHLLQVRRERDVPSKSDDQAKKPQNQVGKMTVKSKQDNYRQPSTSTPSKETSISDRPPRSSGYKGKHFDPDYHKKRKSAQNLESNKNDGKRYNNKSDNEKSGNSDTSHYSKNGKQAMDHRR